MLHSKKRAVVTNFINGYRRTLKKKMRILVGYGSCGKAASADKVYSVLLQKAKKLNNDIKIEITGCVGTCYLEPIVTIENDGHFFDYVKVTVDDIDKILNDVKNLDGNIIDSNAVRIALKNCGRINPENIDDYLTNGGYKDPSIIDIINELKIAQLKGRGGAGFLTHIKWQALKNASGKNKVIICNADEGDPGAFMDRAILEGDPHAVLDGMRQAAYATGANIGFIYVRAEYPLAIKRLQIAIEQAIKKGFLGKNVFGKGRHFNVEIRQGAGAFVCGEETALISSLEGKRGNPKLKPPFPTDKGFFNYPSLINNVETFANVVYIAKFGGSEFSKLGTENSKGTKVFALAGAIKNGGLVEVKMGDTLKSVIYDLGGGVANEKEFKAVQIGGPSGGCIPASLLDTKIDYSELAATGAIMGSGGMVVMDESSCMVDVARFFLDFTAEESCGKCPSCRIGTKRMLEILERITGGRGQDGDIEKLENLGEDIKAGALCGLGQTAPNPVLSAIRHFRQEFIDHIQNKKCVAAVCKKLADLTISQTLCTGCSLCAIKCPVKAISGERGKPFVINNTLCTKCSICKSLCRRGAIL